MEPAAYSGSVAPVYNDLDLLVVGNDGSTDTTFYPNNLATKDSDNTVEVVTISDVDSYESFEVSTNAVGRYGRISSKITDSITQKYGDVSLGNRYCQLKRMRKHGSFDAIYARSYVALSHACAALACQTRKR